MADPRNPFAAQLGQMKLPPSPNFNQQQIDPFGANASPQPGFQFGFGMQDDNPYAMVARWMMSQQPQQQVNNTPENLAALRNDPQGDRNKAYMPGVMNEANPFANGAFLSNNQRMQREKDVLGTPGMTGVQAGMGTPMMPPPYALPMSSPFSGMMPKPAQGPGDYSLVPNGITGPMTPQNDAAAAAEYLRQAKPGGMQKYRR